MKFENLKIRQEAVILYQEISIIFEKEKKYFFKDQILRATLSISNNIAE
jgi:four helix bundle protein